MTIAAECVVGVRRELRLLGQKKPAGREYDEIAVLVALLERTGILTHAEVPLEGLEMWLLRRVAQAVEA